MTDFGPSLSGIRTALFRQDVTANNLANVATPAFEPSRVEQVETLEGGTRISGTPRLGGSAPIQVTGNPFDLAIQGDGFFEIAGAQGPRYTRDGSLRLDGNRNLVTAEGGIVAPGIQIPLDAQSFNISNRGQVRAILADGTVQDVGQIKLSRFRNPGGLSNEGGNLFAATAASGEPFAAVPGDSGLGTLFAGGVEGSGTDLAAELTDLVINKGIFSVNLKAIRAKSQMLGELVDIVG